MQLRVAARLSEAVSKPYQRTRAADAAAAFLRLVAASIAAPLTFGAAA